jgi:hypothetical protein
MKVSIHAGVVMAMMILAAGAASTADELPSVSMADREPAYVNTIDGRSAKIVNEAKIEDPAKAIWAKFALMELYFALNDWQEKYEDERRGLKPNENEADAKRAGEIEAARVAARDRFVAALERELTGEQATAIKDGISYGVRLNTYNAYLMYVPDMPEELKASMMRHLTEARDLAMMGGSANEKHGIFNKYKGRINNELSAAGINMGERQKAHQARQREAEAAANAGN